MKRRRINERLRRRILGESLEPRHLLSAVGFVTHEIVVADTDGLSAVHPADLDGDGDIDVLSASSGDDKIAWYENVDGEGTFAAQQVITTGADGVVSVAVGDLDGDGDLDVLSASAEDDKIAWYENVDGEGTFRPARVITAAAEGALSIAVGDLDGDGDLDLLSAPWRTTLVGRFRCEPGEVSWYENVDGAGSFETQQVIATGPNLASVSVGDLDGDRDLDVLISSHLFRSCSDNWIGYGDSSLEWYENTDGTGSFGTQRVIASAARFSSVGPTTAGDVDGDGDLDVLTDDGAWFENTDAAGTFGPAQWIGDGGSLWADFDGDGDLDVLNHGAWFENTDGAGTFERKPMSSAWSYRDSTAVADFDRDGDLDILAASREGNTIAWHENTEDTSFGPEHVTTIDAIAAADALTVGDVDGDGDEDVVAASNDNVMWYENIETLGAFGPGHVVSQEAAGLSALTMGDLDGDGDLDVVATYLGIWNVATRTYDGGKIAWYDNTDGTGRFGPERVIRADFPTSSVTVGDLDGDGDIDVLAGSWGDLAWYENTDGKGTFAVITTDADGGGSVTIGDLDGDGDLDVLSGNQWLENIDGTGSFAPGQVIARVSCCSFNLPSTLADLNGDGDLDVLMASAWFENTDGRGSFRSWKPTIGGGEIVHLAVGDMDGDGDLDVVQAWSVFDAHGGVLWGENVDGLGSFEQRRAINTGPAAPLAVGDLDADGDLDVIFAAESKTWIAWNDDTIRPRQSGEPQGINVPGPGADPAVALGDLDGDGDLDVVSASSDRQLSWFEKTDEATSFQQQREIGLLRYEPEFVTVGDLDGDGDQDLVSAGKDYVAWHENTDGAGSFVASMINAEFEGSKYVVTNDLDGDGDLDLIVSLLDNGIAWHENTDGKGGFGPKKVIADDVSRSVTVGDMDGDGDLDVVSVLHDGIAWYENMEEAGTFGTRQVVGLDAVGRSSVTLGDVDGDADLDVVVPGIGWYENEDWASSFGPRQAFPVQDVLLGDVDGDGDPDVLPMSREVDYRNEVLGDFDGDGDVDVVSAADGKIVWHENRLAGDADDNGKVEFADFLALSNNFGGAHAVWEDGDFNSDRIVDFADFLILSANSDQESRRRNDSSEFPPSA